MAGRPGHTVNAVGRPSTQPISSSTLRLPGPEGRAWPCAAGNEEPEAIFAPGSLVQAHVREPGPGNSYHHLRLAPLGCTLRAKALGPPCARGCKWVLPWALPGAVGFPRPFHQVGRELPVMVVGDSCTRGQPAGVRGPPLVAGSKESQGGRGHLSGSHVRGPICHVWIRSALPRLKISNKEGLLVPADAAHWPVDSFTGK